MLSWALAIALYYYPVQQAALQSGHAEDFAVFPVALIGVVGAMTGPLVALTLGDRPLPAVVKHVSIGALVGVAMVVIATLFVANLFGGPISKLQAPYLHWGRVFAFPAGFLLGSATGFLVGHLLGRSNEAEVERHLP